MLADVGSHDPEQVWCLGDIVGYGAHPDDCTEMVSEVVEVCLAGNHDLVIRGDIDIRYFAMSAGAAARWGQRIRGQMAQAGPMAMASASARARPAA